jgi:non-ribosomal peptide synthetase-like protein
MAGMKIGQGCEISTIIDVVPELIEIGDECFFADGIYLGGPRIHRGWVTLEKVELKQNTFLGNHVVIQGKQRLPADLFVGVCTVVDDKTMDGKSGWFGRPAFRLHRRDTAEYDRNVTHHPTMIRYINRLFWETLRFTLPVILICTISMWLVALTTYSESYSLPIFILLIIPLLNLSLIGFNCILVLVLKWILIGQVKPGKHPLWSCWCSRWDFLYVAWGVFAKGYLKSVQGTLLISWYLRAMGAKIGRGVLLNNLFTQVVDPDMLTFEDGATVNCLFQAHTFEDRVLKIDRVTIRKNATVGAGAVLLYGADIGESTHVTPFSVVMKNERLLPNRTYTGAPIKEN